MDLKALLPLALGSASLLLVEGARSIAELSTAFENWEIKYGKTYETAEFRDRAFMTWVTNLGTVEAINADRTSTWKAGLNSFADLSQTDFARKMLMDLRSKPTERLPSLKTWTASASQALPGAYDWRDHGAVTPVHDQGSVGTCWAFSTIGNVEGQWFLHTDELTDLSEEFLVDCDGTHDETHADCGVFGGWPYLAYQYIVQAGGVPTEQEWPYCSGTGDCYPCMQGPISLCGPPPYYCEPEIEEQCPSAPKYAKISDWMDISTDEAVIADALYNIGPLSALLDAAQLQFYDSGVWTGHVDGSPAAAACKQGNYDHAVLIVGYGTDDGQDYWTIKNSWGEKWGESGYFRIVRGSSTCGINGEVTTATV